MRFYTTEVAVPVKYDGVEEHRSREHMLEEVRNGICVAIVQCTVLRTRASEATCSVTDRGPEGRIRL